MPRHPSEKFIKYLLVQEYAGGQQNRGLVEFTLANLGFPPATKEYVEWWRNVIYSRAATIPNFDLNNRFNRPTMTFLKDEGVYLLFYQDAALREANSIILNLKVRQVVDSLLLGRLLPRDVAKKVNSRFDEFFTAAGITAYKRYYWDTEGVSVEDWSTLLSDNGNWRKQVETLSIVQTGPAMALHLQGFQQHLESKTILRKMMETVNFDFEWWRTQPPSLERTKAFGSLTRSACALDTQLSSADAAMKETLKAFEQFRMKHTSAQVEDIREAAPAGNFTGSGAKLIEVTRPEDIEELDDESAGKKKVRKRGGAVRMGGGGQEQGPE